MNVRSYAVVPQVPDASFIFFQPINFLCSDWIISVDRSLSPLILLLLQYQVHPVSLILVAVFFSSKISILFFLSSISLLKLCFSICFSTVRNCLLVHFTNSSFKILIR